MFSDERTENVTGYMTPEIDDESEDLEKPSARPIGSRSASLR